MFTPDCLLKLHEWSSATLDLLLAHCASLPLETRHTKVPGFGWPTIHGQLMHIAETEAWWVAMAQHLPFEDWPKDSDWWDFAECERSEDLANRYAEVREATRAFITSLTPEQLQQPRLLQLGGDHGTHISPALMLSHIITHSFHHKGQIVAMSRTLGYPPPETDMDVQIGKTDFTG
jgi:uncharacterized damage-inducible protein DinB